VTIGTVTLAEIKKAAKIYSGESGHLPESQKQRQLVRVPSKGQRIRFLKEAADAIAAKEALALPSHGGRPWKCEVKVLDSTDSVSKSVVSKSGGKKKQGPLFRWFRGKLELACLPHILEKVEVMEIDDIKKCNYLSDEGTDEEDCDDLVVSKNALQERAISTLSSLAWNDPDHHIPLVERIWLSPDHVKYSTRKAAMEHAGELVRRDKLIDRVLHGRGAKGSILRPFKPTKAAALEAGYYRFLRDGLWVVGQEEDWQDEREEVWLRRQERIARVKKDRGEAARVKKEATLQKQKAKANMEKGISAVDVGLPHKVITNDTVVTLLDSATCSPTCSKSDTLSAGSVELQAMESDNDSPPDLKSRRLTPSTHWRLTQQQIDLCYDAAVEHYEKVMYTVKARALFTELADGFDLLRERGRGRFDMELPVFDDPKFSFLTDLERASWMPVVRTILGEDVALVHKGVFLSLPGSEMQVYHQDGPHLTTKYQKPCHAVNVFIPLVDLTRKNGPTEFCLGTHILDYEYFAKEMVETPLAKAGTPIIFDYRLGHRGLGNSSADCRPLVYLTYSPSGGKEFKDSVNFSRKRYIKIGELVEKPLSREERARRRREVIV